MELLLLLSLLLLLLLLLLLSFALVFQTMCSLLSDCKLWYMQITEKNASKTNNGFLQRVSYLLNNSGFV